MDRGSRGNIIETQYITLAELLDLASPILGKTLTIYSSTSRLVVSAILVENRDEKQILVYFVSQVLQEEDIRYSDPEKLAISLANTTRQLRRYFLAHPVEV